MPKSYQDRRVKFVGNIWALKTKANYMWMPNGEYFAHIRATHLADIAEKNALLTYAGTIDHSREVVFIAGVSMI